jgi:hypothetical protein
VPLPSAVATRSLIGRVVRAGFFTDGPPIDCLALPRPFSSAAWGRGAAALRLDVLRDDAEEGGDAGVLRVAMAVCTWGEGPAPEQSVFRPPARPGDNLFTRWR